MSSGGTVDRRAIFRPNPAGGPGIPVNRRAKVLRARSEAEARRLAEALSASAASDDVPPLPAASAQPAPALPGAARNSASAERATR